MKENRRVVLTILLFSIGWAFMYADRNILSPVMATIGKDWGLDKTQLGLMSTVFFIAYAAMQIPSGYLADKFGRLKVLVLGYIFFGIATFCSGLAPAFEMFLLIRVLTGLGEGTYYGSSYGISSNIIPVKYRGVASALINSGMAIGISAGFIGSSYVTLTLHRSWQTSFYVFAIPTVIVALLIGVFVKDTSASDKGKKTVTVKYPTNRLLTRNHILTYVLIFCSLYGFFGMLTWLPYYLQTVRGLQGTQTGIIASLVPWASIPGAIIFGYISDKIKHKKPMIIALAILGALCQFFIPYVHSFGWMITGLIIYGMIGKLALDPVMISYVAEITPRPMYSKAYSIFNFAGMLSSIFAPYITGYFAQITGKLEVGFYLSGIILLVGAFLFLFTYKTTAVAENERIAA